MEELNMETKKKLTNFASIAFKNGDFTLVHRRGYQTIVKFNDEDYTFFISKGKKELGVINENPKWYYTYEASTGLRISGLGSDTIDAAYSQLFNDSFVKIFTQMILSGKIKELQDRFHQLLNK